MELSNTIKEKENFKKITIKPKNKKIKDITILIKYEDEKLENNKINKKKDDFFQNYNNKINQKKEYKDEGYESDSEEEEKDNKDRENISKENC